jgi:hypothetical protein
MNTQIDIGRNSNCPCGSGKKYKRCCYGNEENIVDTTTQTPKEFNWDKFFTKYKEYLFSVDKLHLVKSSYRDDTDFFQRFFFFLWSKFGNQYMQNFDRVWKWVSNLKIEKGSIRTLNGKEKFIPLFRCMTIEEFESMKDGTIKSPSWTTEYQYVTHFKSHQIQTKTTLKSMIVCALFDYDDILHISDLSENECFMKYKSKPMDIQVLVEWGVSDVERIHGHPINSLYLTHSECANGFDNIVETLFKRGLDLKGWVKGEDNVWYSETDHKIIEGSQKIESIIDMWINQFESKD